MGSAPSVLSIVRRTSARPSGGRPEVPAKMTSSILPPRRLLTPCSAMTQLSASTTLDLPAPPPPARSGFTLVATGDLLVHGPVAAQALRDGHGKRYDFRPMIAKVRPLVHGAALAICHIETPLSADDKGISGYPVFNTPHE